MNYIDILPLDVIRVFIFPCLDYNSRGSLMQLLKPEERWEISKYYRISPKSILHMELKFRTVEICKALKACPDYVIDESVRLQNICNLFDTMEKHMVVIQYYTTFRKCFIDKLIECQNRSSQNPDDHTYFGVLGERANRILADIIDSYPFLYDFVVPQRGGWVDGTGVNP